MSREKWDALQAGFGERLREIQRSLGLSQTELAEGLGVSDRSVRSYLTMNHAMPSDVIYELLKLGGDLSFLFAGVAADVAQNAGLETSNDLPELDRDLLAQAAAWVDGEWSDNGDGTRMDEMERLAWVFQTYQQLVSNRIEPAKVRPASGKRAA